MGPCDADRCPFSGQTFSFNFRRPRNQSMTQEGSPQVSYRHCIAYQRAIATWLPLDFSLKFCVAIYWVSSLLFQDDDSYLGIAAIVARMIVSSETVNVDHPDKHFDQVSDAALGNIGRFGCSRGIPPVFLRPSLSA